MWEQGSAAQRSGRQESLTSKGSLWESMCSDAAEVGYRFGTRRAVPPGITLDRIAPLARRAGITRLADVTGLDWVGLPVYQAIRPNSRNLSVSQGKGLTRTQAKVSALMESLECFHAEKIEQPRQWATVQSMRPKLGYEPSRLLVADESLLKDEALVEWVAATDLLNGNPTWIPLQLCDLDLSARDQIHVPLFLTTSVGLAAGNTITEALLHGLCEVIERDCSWRMHGAKFDPSRCVSTSSVYPGLARRMLRRFSDAGIAVHIVDVTGPTGVPCFEVFLSESDAGCFHYGAGCHPSRLTALLRALSEAAQSRLTHIAGTRDDLAVEAYFSDLQPQHARKNDSMLPNGQRRFRSCLSLPVQPLRSTLDDLLRRVRAVTGASAVAVDLARPDFGLPVVFVVAPGLRFALPERLAP